MLWSTAEWRQRTHNQETAGHALYNWFVCAHHSLQNPGLEAPSSSSQLWLQPFPEIGGSPWRGENVLLRGCPGMRTQMLWPEQAGVWMDKPRPVSPTFLCHLSPFSSKSSGMASRPDQGYMMAPSEDSHQAQCLLRGTDSIWRLVTVSRATEWPLPQLNSVSGETGTQAQHFLSPPC